MAVRLTKAQGVVMSYEGTEIRIRIQNWKEGTRGSCISCPVAMAVWDAVGTNHFIVVDTDTITVDDESFKVPARVRDAMLAFDDGRARTKFREMVFNLELV